MIDDIGNVLTWVLCGGMLFAAVILWLYVYFRLAWYSIRKWRTGQ